MLKVLVLRFSRGKGRGADRAVVSELGPGWDFSIPGARHALLPLKSARTDSTVFDRGPSLRAGR